MSRPFRQFRRVAAALVWWAGLSASIAHAAVGVDGTRVIYGAQDREVSVRLTNENTVPALVQVWVDAGDELAAPEEADVPFALVPPIFRMGPGRSQVVRLRYTREPLPLDRETLYWFNALEVPSGSAGAKDGNTLQLAFRTRLKLIFRPVALSGGAATAFKQLKWTWVADGGGTGAALQVFNPSPYYVNFARIGLKIDGGGKLNEGGMVAPRDKAMFRLDARKLPAQLGDTVKVSFDVIDDYGAVREQEADLSR